MRRKPAADPQILKVGIKAFGEIVVGFGVTDEAGIELDRLVDTISG